MCYWQGGKIRARHLYTGVLILAVFWCTLFLSTTWLARENTLSKQISGFIFFLFSPTCHQLPERSIQINGLPMAVCSRCAGVYFGFIIGMMIYPFIKIRDRLDTPSKWPVIIAFSPMIPDFLLNRFGIWESGLWFRHSTGIIGGAVIPFYIMPALMQVSNSLNKKKR